MSQPTSSAENDIVAENERLRSALLAAHVGTWDLNLLTGQIQYSSICKELFGLPADLPVTPALLLQQVHSDDRERVARANAQSVSPFNTADHDITFRTLNPSGTFRWVHAKGQTIRNEQGLAVRFSGTVQDVTQTMVAQQKIEESELFSQNVFFNSPVAKAVFIGDQLMIRTINENMLAMFDCDDSVVGRPFAEAIPALATPSLLEQLRLVQATGETFYQPEQPIHFRRNEQVSTGYYNFICKALYNTAGEIYGSMVTATDVTGQVAARQQTESAQATLLQLTQRLTLALDAGKLGSYDLDLTTNRMECTPQCKANFGLGPEATFHFEDLLRTIVDEDRPLVEQAVAQAINTHGIYQAEYRVIWPDGSRHWIKASGLPSYSPTGQPIRIIGVTQEITTERQYKQDLEQQVRERTEELAARNEELAETIRDLQRSNQNLEQFAYIASHDLQEPLRKIQSFGTILQDQYGGQLGPVGKDMIDRMQVASGRMSTLIRDLLTFSRISTRQQASRPIALNDVVQNSLLDLELAIQETGAQIHVSPLPVLPGDFSQLSQLFTNLLSNALKFRRPGINPVITITAHRLPASALPPSVKPARMAAVYHCINVSDNGIGFDEKYLDRIFQIFQRLHGRSEYVGTGIGLAICEKVTLNHGGAITATSQPNQGATFSLYFPQ
ncbi:hypothetical protein GCM10027347_10990 [Larkinella harenae]